MTCETFLLNVAVGPVGRYIGQGRRSRDLWFRSRALSEVTRIAAEALHGYFIAGGPQSVELILPTPQRIAQSFLPKLKNDQENEGPWQHQGPTISNKIYAKVTASAEEIPCLVEEARRKILKSLNSWLKAAQEWAQTQGGKDLALNEGAFRAQREAIAKGDFLEFFAVWVPLSGSDEEGFHALRQAMNARKSLREFDAPTWSSEGKPRSSSNPNWSSVFDEPSDDNQLKDAVIARNKLGIRRQERLDALSLLSRFAEFRSTADERNQGGIKLPALSFPPIHRVAADPWLEGVDQGDIEVVSQKLDRNRKKPELMLIASRVEVARNKDGQNKGRKDPFPWDPSLFFEGNLLAKKRECSRKELRAVNHRNIPIEESGPWRDAWNIIQDIWDPVLKIQRKFGCPTPYYAMLEADGDSIGSIIDGLTTAQRIELAKALYVFSDEAYRIIEEHGGYAFYSAGDEVKAYLPIDKVLTAYEALHKAFKEYVKEADGFKEALACSGLSGAIVIAHAKDDLRRVRSRVSELLSETKNRKKRAKQNDAKESWLAVEEQPAGGPPRTVYDPQETLLAQFENLVTFAENSELSKSTAHTLLSLYQRFKETPGSEKDNILSVEIGLASVLQKGRRSGSENQKELKKVIRDLLSNGATWEDLRKLANKIIIAERIARAKLERAGKGNTKEEGQ